MSEKSHLITQQLINSIDWMLEAPDFIIKPERGGDGKLTWSQKAYEDLVKLLSREPGEFPEAARRGIEFEKQIYKYAGLAEKIIQKRSAEFKEVVDEIRGFRFGQKGKKTINIEGMECFLYAKYDAIKEPIVKDIKTTQKFQYEKFANSFQHPLYSYISECDEFYYIIAEWKEFPEIKRIHKLRFRFDPKKLEAQVKLKIFESLEVLKEFELWDLYREKFCLY